MKQFIDAAIQELSNKEWGIVEQFLEVHNIEKVNGDPKVAYVDTAHKEGEAAVYFNVEKEKFFFVIAVDTETLEINWKDTVPYIYMLFRARSKNLTLAELASKTTLAPHTQRSYSIGDKRPRTEKLHDHSFIEFEPCPDPGKFEDKMDAVLGFLEQDKSGVQTLCESHEGYLQIIMSFHNGNTMLGGAWVNRKAIKRLAALNIELDFDLYAEGNFFKEESYDD